MNKIYNKGFLLLIISVVTLSVGYPLYKTFYIEPQKYKSLLRKEIIERYPEIPDSSVRGYCNCLYDKFKNNYGSVSKFPERNNYTYSDKINIVDCTIKYLIIDSAEKERAHVLKDSIALNLK